MCTPFVSVLRRRGLIEPSLQLRPQGYSYFMRNQVDIGRVGNAFVVGDAAGLATRDMAEGIGPSIRSGMHAAESIAEGAEYDLSAVSAYSLPPGLPRRALEYLLLRRNNKVSAGNHF